MKEVKVYDFAGVLVDISGAFDHLKKVNPELYDQYQVQGMKDHELRKGVRPQVMGWYENAVEQGSFPMPLFPDAKGRLEEDKRQGYVRVVFTGNSRSTLTEQIKDIGIEDHLDELVVLDDLRESSPHLTGLTKEDPEVFESLIKYLHKEADFRELLTYTDDGLKRVKAAVQANKKAEHFGFRWIYHLDRKATRREIMGEFLKANSLWDIETKNIGYLFDPIRNM